MIFIPSLFTFLNLFAGFCAVYLFYHGYSLKLSCIFIFTALIFDGLDGYTARLLNRETKSGIILDSIADFFTFGLAPVLLLHRTMHLPHAPIGLIILGLYTAATALRLILFSYFQLKNKKSSFFSGLPSPASAGLLLSFMFVGISPDKHPEFYFILLFLLAGLMLSSIPFPKFHLIHWQPFGVVTFLAFLGFWTAFQAQAIPAAVFMTYLAYGIIHAFRYSGYWKTVALRFHKREI